MKESKLPKRFWLIIAVAMILVSMIDPIWCKVMAGK